MKVRLADLNEIRTNMAAYRERLANPQAREFFNLSRFRALVYCVAYYHNNSNDLELAVKHLDEIYWRNFKQQKSFEVLCDQLRHYALEFQATGNTVVKCRFNTDVVLTHDIRLSGEIGRLDISASGGYAVWLLQKEAGDWQSDLRLPLLQGHFSDIWKVPEDQVTVGIYDFELGQHQFTVFSARDIEDARQLATDLIGQI